VEDETPLQPPVLGMVGGGYRTRLTAQAAISLGIDFRVLAQATDDSAAQVAPGPGCVVGDSRSADDVTVFAAGCEILTFEDQFVLEELLAKLESSTVAIRPGPSSFRLVRDKVALRDWLGSLGIDNELAASATRAVPPASAGPAAPPFPPVRPSSPASPASPAPPSPPASPAPPSPPARELAVVVARSPEGQGVTYPVTLMLRRDGQRREFISPAPEFAPDLAIQAQQTALKIAAELHLTGLLTVELAESGGKLSVTDLAVSPHDAGLWTMDAAVTSQFEQYLRAVLDLPFGTPGATAPHAVTVTVLGGDDPDVFTRFVHVMAADPGARVHIYTNQVSQIRPASRVGHVTIAGDDLDRARDRAWRAANYLGLGTEEPTSY
jgi:5-(carboxyamino)imidazole ribonucleotide synthase